MNKQQLVKSKKSSNINFTQDFIEIADISNGLIFLKNGSVVKILELMPINYDEKSDETKDAIADLFGLSFKKFPRNGQLKVMSTKANINAFENKMQERISLEKDEKVVERMKDYLQHVKSLQQNNSLKKRFFYIFSYEGDANEKISSDFEEIYNTMHIQMSVIASAFAQTGNYVLNADDDNKYEAEILYSFFNPGTREEEGIDQRIASVTNAVTALKRKGIDKVPHTIDYIAPRGIQMLPFDSMVMDGMYHTFLALRDNAFPSNAYAGWLEKITNEDESCDLDIHFHQAFKESTIALLDRATLIRKGSAASYEGNSAKQEELLEKASNSEYMLDLLQKNDEELYNVTIIVTLRARSRKELVSKKATFIKNLKTISLYFDDSFLQTQDYFKMVMPLNYKISSICKANNRNMTNSSLATLFCMTTYEMFDPNGWVLGTLDKNGTLFSYDAFNTRLVNNPMITITGQIGSGKTYTELMLASRMRMDGIKVFFVLPLKGYEYEDAVKSLGGSFVQIFPGSKVCINIMEIRPEGNAKIDEDMDEETKNALSANFSLRAKKIESLITWITLLIGQELPYEVEGEINAAITRVYDRFGITDNNDTIWENRQRGILKKMPILSDLYEEIRPIPQLSRVSSMLKTWTEGNCSNMNGQTNVDLSSSVIAFDVNEDIIGARLLPAFMYIAFDIAYAGAKENLDEKCGLFLDESWKFLDIPSCGQQIRKMVKILRAYNTAVVNATQSIEDYLKNEYGRSILSSSGTKIFLKCSVDEVDALARSVSLSEENKYEIQGVLRGYGFIAFNTERLKVHFQSSDWEEELYTPGEKKKKAIRERRMIKQGI